jgi:TP901 family phage tail tape measure protein
MADNVESRIDLNIDVSNALASIKTLQAQISAFHQSIRNSGNAVNQAVSDNLTKNLLNSINATQKFSASLTTVSDSSQSFTNALERNKLSMGQYFRFAGGASKNFGRLFRSEFDTIEKVARERVKTLQTQYIRMGRDANGALEAIRVRPLRLDMEQLGTQVAMTAQKQQMFNQLVKQGSTNLLNFGKNTQWAGRQLMVGFTIPLSIMGGMAIKEFDKIEKQAIRFKRVYGDAFSTDAETDAALANIRKLATEFTKYGVEVEKTLELAADAAQMGLKGADLNAQVAEATRLAVLGEVEQQEALKATIAVTNTFGIAAEDLAEKINFLNAVENETLTAISDLTIAIPKAGPVVKQLGGSVEDLAFFLTAMKEGGINASEGANALKSALSKVINPTEKASEMLAGFGININSIVEGNAGDIKTTILELGAAFDRLDPLSRSRAIEQLFGTFQFARISTLFNNINKEGGQAQKVLELSRATSEQLAILSERELKRVEDSPIFKFEKAIERLQESLAPLGAEFIKIITPLIEFGTKILKSFNEMDEGAKSFVTNVVTVLGLIAPVAIMTFGLIANGIANFIKGVSLVGGLLGKVAGAGTGLNQMTQYMTQEQLEATAAASALGHSHSMLTTTFTAEKVALDGLVGSYNNAITAINRYNVASQSRSRPGQTPTTRAYARGVLSVPGPKGAGDVIPAMLSPGEAVIPAAEAEKYRGFISQMISGNVPGFAKGVMLGMPRSSKAVAKDTANAQAIFENVKKSRFANVQPTQYGHQLAKTTGHSFPLFGVGGVYLAPSGKKVFVKPVLDETAAIAEMRGTQIARQAHGLKAPQQRIVVMRDPYDTKRQRKFLALESDLDATFVNNDPKSVFNEEQYFRQLVASLVRVDKDLAAGNMFGDVVADVGPAGVFSRASGIRDYTSDLPSMEQQAMVNLLGVKGGAKRAFAESTVGLMAGMSPQQYQQKMITEIQRVLPALRQTIAGFGLTDQKEIDAYTGMARRLEQGLSVDWSKFHAIHSGVKVTAPKPRQTDTQIRGYADGVLTVPGPRGKGDVVPAMLSPGEAVIPAQKAKKYRGLISSIIKGDIPGFRLGRLGTSKIGYPVSKTAKEKDVRAEDFDKDKLGGTPGGMRKLDGKKHYVKRLDSAPEATSEILSSALFSAMGSRGPRLQMLNSRTVASKIIPGLIPSDRASLSSWIAKQKNPKQAAAQVAQALKGYIEKDVPFNAAIGNIDAHSENILFNPRTKRFENIDLGNNTLAGFTGLSDFGSVAYDDTTRMKSDAYGSIKDLLGRGEASKIFRALKMNPSGKGTSFARDASGEIDKMADILGFDLSKTSRTDPATSPANNKFVQQLIAENPALASQLDFGKLTGTSGKTLEASLRTLFTRLKKAKKTPYQFYADGVLDVPGPKGAGDVVPAMLSPGEAVIPADKARKYRGFISQMISGNIPGFLGGTENVSTRQLRLQRRPDEQEAHFAGPMNQDQIKASNIDEVFPAFSKMTDAIQGVTKVLTDFTGLVSSRLNQDLRPTAGGIEPSEFENRWNQEEPGMFDRALVRSRADGKNIDLSDPEILSAADSIQVEIGPEAARMAREAGVAVTDPIVEKAAEAVLQRSKEQGGKKATVADSLQNRKESFGGYRTSPLDMREQGYASAPDFLDKKITSGEAAVKGSYVVETGSGEDVPIGRFKSSGKARDTSNPRSMFTGKTPTFEARESFYNVQGKKIESEKIAKGVSDEAEPLNTGKKIGKNLIAGVKQGADEEGKMASPSREMYERGKNLVRGMLNGVQDGYRESTGKPLPTSGGPSLPPPPGFEQKAPAFKPPSDLDKGRALGKNLFGKVERAAEKALLEGPIGRTKMGGALKETFIANALSDANAASGGRGAVVTDSQGNTLAQTPNLAGETQLVASRRQLIEQERLVQSINQNQIIQEQGLLNEEQVNLYNEDGTLKTRRQLLEEEKALQNRKAATAKEERRTLSQAKAQNRQARAGKALGVLGTASMVAGMASGVDGKVGELAQKVMPALFGLSAMAPILMALPGPLALLATGVGIVAATLYSMNAVVKRLKEDAKKLTDQFGSSAETLQKFAEAASNITGSEIMSKRRASASSIFPIVEGKQSFGSSFLQSEFGKGMAASAPSLINSLGAVGAESRILQQISDAVLSGALTVPQARSIVEELSVQLKNQSLGVNLQAKITELFGPNGEALSEGGAIDIRINVLEEGVENFEESLSSAVESFSSTFNNSFERDLASAAIDFFGGIPLLGDVLKEQGLNATEKQIEDYWSAISFAASDATSVVSNYQASLDQVDVVYEGLIKKAKESNNLGLVSELESKRIKERTRLIESQGLAIERLGLGFSGLSLDADGTISTYATDVLDAVDKNILSRYESGSKEYKDMERALTELGKITFGPTVDEDATVEFQIKTLIDSGELSTTALNNILSLEGFSAPTAKNVITLIGKLGSGETSKALDLMGLFVNDDGTPNINQRANFIAQLSAEANPNKYLDMFADISRYGYVLDVTAIFNTVLDDPKKSMQLLDQLDKIDELEKQDKQITVDYIQKTTTLGDISMAALRKDQEYFEKLDPVQQILYLRGLVTMEVSGIQAMEDFAQFRARKFGEAGLSSMLSSGVGEGIVESQALKIGADQASFAAEQMKLITQIRSAFASDPNSGGGGGDKTDPFENILSQLKLLRNAAINAKGGLKELRGILGDSAKEMKAFRGVSQKLLAEGFSREFIDSVMSMDEESRKNFISIEKGVITVTEAGRALNKAFNESALGNYQNTLAETAIGINAQVTAMAKLTAEGVPLATASEMVQDKTVAIAIAAGATKEEIWALKNAFDAVTEAEKNFANATPEGRQQQLESVISEANAYFAAQETMYNQQYEAAVKAYEDANDITEAQRDLADREFALDDLQFDLNSIAEQESKINDQYDKRQEAIENIFRANKAIIDQDKERLDIAGALASGDLAAAAKAMRAQTVANLERNKEQQLDNLQRSRDLEISQVRGDSGKSRLELEEAILAIEKEIADIQEKKLEPYQRELDLLGRIRDDGIKDVQAAGFLGKTQAAWAAIANEVDRARLNVDAYEASLAAQLKGIPGITVTDSGDGTFSVGVDAKQLVTQEMDPPPTPTESTGETALQGSIAEVNPNQAEIDELNRLRKISRQKFKDSKDEAFKKRLFDMNVRRGERIKELGGVAMAMGGIVKYLRMGGMLPYKSEGGSIFKPMGTDTVPAMLTPGEFVVRRRAVSNFGLDKLNAINTGTYSGESVYNYSVNVNVKSDANPDEIARNVMTQIKRIDSQRIRSNNY